MRTTGSRFLGAPVALMALAGIAGCKKDPALARADAQANEEPAAQLALPALPDAGPPLAGPRCAPTEGRVHLADAAGSDVEIGEGIETKRGYALGLVRTTPKGRVASVALVPLNLTKATVIDLGAAVGDAPPPRPFAQADALAVAYHARAAARSLEIFRLGGEGAAGKLQPAHSVPQPGDESFAIDAAFGAANGVVVVAWDEDAPGGTHGTVRAAAGSAVGGGADAGAALVAGAATLSAKGTDAEGPRLARRPGGFWAVWIARRADTTRDGARDGGAARPRAPRVESEAPGEDRDVRWLEAVALDDAARPVGPVRALTPHSGHVGSFDLWSRGDGAALDVVARDETEARDGAGGRVSRITLREGGADAPVVLAETGVGQMSADVLASAAGDGALVLPWLAYVDPAEHTRLQPLTATGEPSGAPSVEPALEGIRPMFLAPGADGRIVVLAASSDKGGADLRAFACGR